jgi:predicted acyltransferase
VTKLEIAIFYYFYDSELLHQMAKNIERLVSLDIFRGLTIAFMIVVNTPGSWEYIYPPLHHSEWNGCTPTDMVFPFFLFIAGVSMWYSMKKYGHEISGGSIFRILRRVAAIFAVGLFLSIFPNFGMDYSYMRIMGVLQRIALAYGIAAILCLAFNRDRLWIVLAVILLVYWFLLTLFGGTEPFGLENNLVRKIDIALLGENHLYKGFGIPFDPEGLLSTLPSVATVIIGYYTGEIIGKETASVRTVLKIILLGVASIGLGLLWSIFFPINKPLWTSSYVLFTGGIAMIGFSFIYLLSDVWKFQVWGKPFMIFGTNALISYFFAGIWSALLWFVHIPQGSETTSLYAWIYEKLFVPVAGNFGGSLIFAVVQMIIIWFIALILYRKKIVIRL